MARRSLLQFARSLKGHQDQSAVKAALDAWYREVRRAEWSNSADLKRDFGAASIVGSDRAVFNIKGNAYRLITEINYQSRRIFLRHVLTHADYSKGGWKK